MEAMFKIFPDTTVINLLYIIVSLFLLYFGADILVKGSASLALSFGIQKIIVGLTLVAYGTSMPEFTVSLISQIQGQTDVSVGNVIGSNILNIGIVLGISAIVRPITVNRVFIKQEVPVLIVFTLIFNLMCLDGKISYNHGIILLILFTVYAIFTVYNAKKTKAADMDNVKEVKGGRGKQIFLVIAGIIVLVLASSMLIKGGVFVAKKIGISELVIGLTLIALGTSLPELFTSIIAAIKKEADISIGNVIGSNLFNIFFILGIASLFGTMTLDRNIYLFSNWVNLLFTVALLPIMFTGYKISRLEGVGILFIYVLYTLNLYYKWIYF